MPWGAPRAVASGDCAPPAHHVCLPVCMEQDGRLIAAGGYNVNMAKVFDRTAGNSIVGTLAGLSRGVFSVDFGPENRLAVAGGDAAVRLFDVVNEGDGGEFDRLLTLDHHEPVKDESEGKK